ncbi:hypothetical protein GUJ93_ZPchr0012g21086 [Zizania palustris]|uniref:Uncharacterized protein n=1 Tax=Zizania palustris TaxID=103762 RepID=A0A8J5WTH2_ZIZPA|nr:hypothetical protein GUJ93_ZPchr0012g21086 [Zizania palustris]
MPKHPSAEHFAPDDEALALLAVTAETPAVTCHREHARPLPLGTLLVDLATVFDVGLFDGTLPARSPRFQ